MDFWPLLAISWMALKSAPEVQTIYVLEAFPSPFIRDFWHYCRSLGQIVLKRIKPGQLKAVRLALGREILVLGFFSSISIFLVN